MKKKISLTLNPHAVAFEKAYTAATSSDHRLNPTASTFVPKMPPCRVQQLPVSPPENSLEEKLRACQFRTGKISFMTSQGKFRKWPQYPDGHIFHYNIVDVIKDKNNGRWLTDSDINNFNAFSVIINENRDTFTMSDYIVFYFNSTFLRSKLQTIFMNKRIPASDIILGKITCSPNKTSDKKTMVVLLVKAILFAKKPFVAKKEWFRLKKHSLKRT